MAIRNILKENDEFLQKKSRPVTEFNERLWQLIDDMVETMHAAEGVGLAAPQVGILRRVFVADTGDGLIEAVNPVVISKKGKQEDVEGCLSYPGQYGITRRPAYVEIKAQDRYGNEFTIDGVEMKARCLCHETDHLDGILFHKHVVRMLSPDELEF